MRALTLHQPWATAVALGVKTVETRSWATSYRGPLAIHAGTSDVGLLQRSPSGRRWDLTSQALALSPTTTRSRALPGYAGRNGYRRKPAVQLDGRPLPLGAVVATCTLVDVVPIVGPGCVVGPSVYVPDHRAAAHPGSAGTLWTWQVPHDGKAVPYHGWVDITDQLPWGDYRPGRYAWLLADITPLPDPIPARGRQGLWTINLEGL